MDLGRDVLHVIEGPVVDSAEPIDEAGSRTAELPTPGVVAVLSAGPVDPLVPLPGSGLRGWVGRVRWAVVRNGVPLLVVAVLTALPMHFFVGRVDDTVVAAPALSDMLGGVGLLLLPLMWVAYFVVSALPLVLCLAGTVGTVLPMAADGERPGGRAVWRLVAYRLRPLWLWLAGFSVVAQVLPQLLTADRVGAGLAVPLALVFTLLSAGVFAFLGILGCVVLVERGHGPARALHLLSITPAAGLAVASLAFAALPRLAEAAWGSVAATAVAVVGAVFWAVAALVTYGQARRQEGPVTSGSLRRELATPEID
ncbi:hypothetical protein ACWKSP_16370 [Micromonosporaceae bacterium Da 78-11]